MAGAARPTASLRAHLLLLVLGTTIPALLVAAFLVQRVVSANRAAVERQLLEAARAEAAVVDAELDGTLRALQGLAQSDRLTTGEIPQFYAQARRLLATQPTWSAVSLSTPDGRQVMNTERPLGDALMAVTDLEHFKRVVASRTPGIGNLRVGLLTQSMGFPARVPVIRDGRVVYVLSAWITSANFATVLTKQSMMPDDWVHGVIDGTGRIVARSREPERFVGKAAGESVLRRLDKADQAVYRDMNLDGTLIYGASIRAPKSRWIAGVGVPASVVDAAFRHSMLALGGAALVLLGFAGGAAYAISRRIARDISRSAAQAEAIAVGLRPPQAESQVTEVQRLLDALARSAVLLDARQRERDAEVARADAARAEAEAADRAKDEFLAMLGHELRNPLAPALTALHLMKLRGGTAATRERDVLERQIRHMARLVEDLLDVSRLRRGAIDLRKERVELAEIVTRAVEMTSPLFIEKQHKVDVRIPDGLIIDADKVRIAQVLANLLTNSAKYTERGGRISLHAHQDDGQVVIECCDNGIGIVPDLLPHVFDLFVQGPRGLDRRHGGLGLGLGVARSLVELHGGTIDAASDGMDRGSTFTVRLPVASPVTAAPTPPAAIDHSSSQLAPIGRVLVVDDNRDALDTLVEALKEAGLEAFGAATPEEAVDVAARTTPNVAVLDIGLPGMTGFDLARALRGRANGASIRLIALTGYGRAQDAAAAREAGFDVFLVKPVDISALIATLQNTAADASGHQSVS
jgi:signal transduction histidine kinase/ActR/RegA family two-component response regulator